MTRAHGMGRLAVATVVAAGGLVASREPWVRAAAHAQAAQAQMVPPDAAGPAAARERAARPGRSLRVDRAALLRRYPVDQSPERFARLQSTTRLAGPR